MKKSIFIFLGIILSLFTLVYAQEADKQLEGWNGDVSLGIALARGNSNTTNIALSFAAEKLLSKNFIWINSGSYLLGRTDNIKNSESIEITSAAKWSHSEDFFTRIEIFALLDKFKNFNYRLVPHLGIGYKIFRSDKIEASLMTGISGVFTKFEDSGETDFFTGILIGNDCAWKISSAAEFVQKLSINSNFSRLNNYFARFEMSLSAAIAGGWALKISMIDKYESLPVGEGLVKNDVIFLTNLSWNF
jgi:putative salt-induced outer membrane protein YdiY